MAHRHRVLLSVFLALGFLTYAKFSFAQWPPWRKEKTREIHFPEMTVSPSWVAKHLDRHSVVLLDARPRDAYDAGHIPGALSLSALDVEDTSHLPHQLDLAGLTGRETCVCYADRDTFRSAAFLYWLLAWAGHDEIRLLDGGIDAWQNEGHAIVREYPAPQPTRWPSLPDSSVLATREYIRDHYGRPHPGIPEFEILDARPEEVWSGRAPVTRESYARFPRSGHIPHSLSFDFAALLPEHGHFPDPRKIRDEIARIGPRPSTTVNLDAEFIVTDDGDSRAGALGFVLLRMAGFERVRYFPGGWREWSADLSLPVVCIVTARETSDALAAGRAIVFDLRHSGEFNAGHIPGALLLAAHTFADSLEVELDRNRPGVDRAGTLLVGYCYGPDCIRSRNCTTIAAQHGFLRLGWLRGGMPEWKVAGLPIEREKVQEDKSWLDWLRRK